MKSIIEPPDAIIITISQQMFKEKGVRNWARNFFEAMSEEDWLYYFRQGNQPKYQVMWVYLCIGNRIRYRVNLVETWGEETLRFSDGKILYGKAWIIACGPVVKAPAQIYRKGFQGFRYTQKLF